MENKENSTSLLDIIIMAALISLLVLVSNISLLILGLIPIFTSIFIFRDGLERFIASWLLSFFISQLFGNFKNVVMIFGWILLVTLSFSLAIKYITNDKNQLVLVCMLISLIFIGLYTFNLYDLDISIADMGKELKEIMEDTYHYDIPVYYYEISFALYPTIFTFVGIIYSIISLKLIRNFIAIKYQTKSDLTGLNKIRIENKDLVFILIVGLVIYFAGRFFDVKSVFVISNLIGLGFLLLCLNGLSAYDFMISKANSSFLRAFQWFLIIFLFQIMAIFFVILGFIDIIINIRRKRRPI